MTPKGVFNHWSGKAHKHAAHAALVRVRVGPGPLIRVLGGKNKNEDDVPYISAPIEILENVNVSPIYRRCELEVRGSNPLDSVPLGFSLLKNSSSCNPRWTIHDTKKV